MSERLSLQHVADRCPNLARNHVANHVDAASVMLDKFHTPPAAGTLHDTDGQSGVEFDWAPPDAVLMETHANELDATEDGAYAVAFAVVMSRGFVVRRRAHHGSGSDYLLTPAGEPDNDFVKLEVSGIARVRQQPHLLRGRLAEKVAQIGRGDLQRPGVAVVVGFDHAQILMEDWR